MRHNRLLRRAVENAYIQTAFHVAGGIGLGLLLAPLLGLGNAAPLGIMLIAAAVVGHFYAVWSDPGSGK